MNKIAIVGYIYFTSKDLNENFVWKFVGTNESTFLHKYRRTLWISLNMKWESVWMLEIKKKSGNVEREREREREGGGIHL